jgi:pectate lyase
MSFSSRVKASYFSHPLYGHGYQCQGGYGGTIYTVNNSSQLTTAVAASGPKRIHITTAGEYTLSEDLDFSISNTDFINTSGGNVQFTGGGLRLGSGVTDLYNGGPV